MEKFDLLDMRGGFVASSVVVVGWRVEIDPLAPPKTIARDFFILAREAEERGLSGLAEEFLSQAAEWERKRGPCPQCGGRGCWVCDY